MPWAADAGAHADFGDTRLDARLGTLLSDLGRRPNLRLPAACGGRAALKAAERSFDNDRGTFDTARAPQVGRTKERMAAPPVVLLVRDTTEADLTRPEQLVQGAGELDGARRGFFCCTPCTPARPPARPWGRWGPRCATAPRASRTRRRRRKSGRGNRRPSRRQVRTAVEYYGVRWGIEVLFRTLKSGGHIERRRFEHPDRVLPCVRGWDVVLFQDRGSPHTAGTSVALAAELGLEIRWLPKATPELNAMDQLWRRTTGEVLASRPTESVDASADAACAYILGLRRRERLRKAGILSGRFWLAD